MPLGAFIPSLSANNTYGIIPDNFNISCIPHKSNTSSAAVVTQRPDFAAIGGYCAARDFALVSSHIHTSFICTRDGWGYKPFYRLHTYLVSGTSNESGCPLLHRYSLVLTVVIEVYVARAFLFRNDLLMPLSVLDPSLELYSIGLEIADL